MRTHTQAASRPRRARFGALGLAAALGLAVAALLGPASPALAHDQLIDVGFDTTDTGEASALRLTYSDNVLAVGTELYVTDADGGDVGSTPATVSGRDVVQLLDTPLADGDYRCVWRVVSSDGHPIEGGFGFDIASGKPGEITPLDAAGEQAGSGSSDEGDEANQNGDTSTGSGGPGWILPVGIGAAVVIAAAVVFPLTVRKRRTQDPTSTAPPANQE